MTKPLSTEPATASSRDAALLTLARGFLILEELAGSSARGGLTHAELATRLGFQRSTLYRYLACLEKLGFIEPAGDTYGYRLGTRILYLAAAALRERSFLQSAKPFVNELAAATGETAHATIWDSGYAMTVEMADGAGPIGPRISVGSRRPAHCSASGKVFLAYQPAAVRDDFLQRPLERRTPATLVSAEALRDHLDGVRRAGYALDQMEYDEGIICLAAPVFDVRHHVVGSLSISIAAMSLSPERLDGLLRLLLACASRFSAQLGDHEGRS